MINIPVLKPMFLDFLSFSSVFLGLVFYVSSQGVFGKDIYHDTIMINDTKTISCTISATYYAKTTSIS